MKIIDVKSWKRRAAYENFIGYSNPVFSLSTRLDVTALYERCKRENTSFFTDFLYIVMQSLNSIGEFRLRIKDGNVVSYDVIHPSFIVLNDENAIVTCRTAMKENYGEFYKTVRQEIQRAKKSGYYSPFNAVGGNDFYYISCLPWTDITAVNNPYDYKDAESTSIPRLLWGKFVDENGAKKMTMDIAAHHALIDGEPVCRAFNLIQSRLLKADEFLREKKDER